MVYNEALPFLSLETVDLEKVESILISINLLELVSSYFFSSEEILLLI